MGKHDKHEENTTTFAWQPMPDDWYKARISALERENLELKAENEAKDKSIIGYERVIDHIDASHDAEIEEYQARIKVLERAVLNGAIREATE